MGIQNKIQTFVSNCLSEVHFYAVNKLMYGNEKKFALLSRIVYLKSINFFAVDKLMSGNIKKFGLLSRIVHLKCIYLCSPYIYAVHKLIYGNINKKIQTLVSNCLSEVHKLLCCR